MRTTVTLDPDAAQIIAHRMRERRHSLSRALNDVIRESAMTRADRPTFSTATADLGTARIGVDHSLRIAGALDDAAVLNGLDTRS